jgi:predicted alpha/beta-fold hydrolase
VVAYTHTHLADGWTRRPVVLIIHGLEGSADSSYARGTAIKAYRAGFNVIRYNVRNCGGTDGLTPTLYHSGLTIDLHHVIRELIEADGVERLFIVGFSMGGNQSLKLAGELGEQAPRQLKGVCAVSPPIDLASCSKAIREPRNWIYEQRFVRSLARRMREKDRLFPGRYDLRELDGIRHLWDWDDRFQPYNGFCDARDYYEKASSISYLPSIKVPTLIIHAEDDPFIPVAPFGDERLRENPQIRLLLTRHGGHVAFCGVRQADEDRAWAENRAVEFFKRLARDGQDRAKAERRKEG